MAQLKVLIVGASIAGPMTAYWFAKAGAEVTIVERHSELRTSGQAIDVRTTGVTIMRKIPGMETSIRAKTTQMEGMSFVRDDGRPYGVIRATGDPDQQSLVSEYEIFRGDLARILYDLTKANPRVRYIFGEQISSMKQDEGENGPIKVGFANGSEASEYDVVVACDGATSRTRVMGFGGSDCDFIHPVNLWAAYFTIKQELIKGSQVSQAHSAIGGRFFALLNDPAGGTRVTLMCIHPHGKPDATLPFREAIKQGEEPLRRFIAEHYKDAGWKSKEAMDAMMTSSDFYANEMVQVKLPSLHKGRFVAVGDAGYAPGPTGTGTTLAMTGAYILAGEVCKHKSDLAAGLKAYEERMRPIIDDMQKIPPIMLSFCAPQTSWGIRLRNIVFAFVAWTNILEYVQKFFGSAFADRDKYSLPEYDWME